MEGLALTEAQSELLADAVSDYSTARAKVEERLADLHNRIGLAVRSGDLVAARTMSAKLEEFPNPLVEDGQFRLRVLEVLTEKQLAFLAENFPVLLSERWRGGGWALVRARNHPRRGPHGHKNDG